MRETLFSTVKMMNQATVDHEIKILATEMVKFAEKQADGTYKTTFGKIFKDEVLEQTLESLVRSNDPTEKRRQNTNVCVCCHEIDLGFTFPDLKLSVLRLGWHHEGRSPRWCHPVQGRDALARRSRQRTFLTVSVRCANRLFTSKI